MKPIILLLFCISLMACEKHADKTPQMQIKHSDTDFSIIALGELEAVNATPISATPSGRRTQTIAWIVEQYTKVKKGDVIVKFDGTQFQDVVDAAQVEVLKLNYDRLQKQRELHNSLQDFNNEGAVVDFEYLMAQQFNIDNPLLYTKIEMIEASDNEEYLQAKSTYIDNMSGHFQDKSDSEIQLLDSKVQIQKLTLDSNQANLSQLEITAPHDGIVVLKKNWDGTYPQVGKSIFSGMAIASLPDLSAMKATIYIPEIEAVGIKIGQKVDITMDAYVHDYFTATISQISKTAQPLDLESPVKYFVISATINEKDEAKLLPGQRLKAKIYTAINQQALIVPIQTLFRNKQETWVYLKQSNGQFNKKQVTTGICSSSQCVIESGLQENDIIALTEPQDLTQKTQP